MDQTEPSPGELRDAAEELREGSPGWVRFDEGADWRCRVAAWLERQASERDQCLAVTSNLREATAPTSPPTT